MEFLFTAQWASIESLVVILCIGVILSIYAYDAFFFLKQCYMVLFPKKPVWESNNETLSGEESINTLYEEIPVQENPVISEEVIVDHPVFHTEAELEEQRIEDKDKDKGKSEEMDDSIITGNDTVQKEEAILEPENIWEEGKAEENITETLEEGIENKKIEENSIEIQETEIIHYERDEIRDGVITHEEIDIIIQEGENIIIEKNKEENIVEEAPTLIEEKVIVENTESVQPQSFSVSKNHTETLYNLIQQIRTNIARGHIADAKALIVTGLALDKKNRDLNVILAELYELDRQFDKAEYIYKDLAEENPNDTQILEKLANILIIQKRYEIALALYQKIVDLSSETEGNLYIMTHLASELGQTEEKYEYAKRYQKKYPNNPDILGLLAQAEIELWYRQDAIQTLIKLKNLTPYNHEITEMITKLVTEEELANNFGN